MKVAILDDYTDTARTTPAFAKLAGHEVSVYTDRAPSLETLAERLKDAEALILIRERMQVGEALLSRLPKLKMISHQSWHPNVDVDACTRRGVVFCDGRGTNRKYFASMSSTAELTWALILAAMRGLPREIAALKAGVWQVSAGRTVAGKTLGIFGYGRTGRRVGLIGRAFGMDVLVWGREGSKARATEDGLRIATGKAELFETSDVLCVEVQLLPETHGIVTAEDLGRMKPDALFVNTARAPLVEPGALAAALKAGRPGFAAVDVFEQEPVVGGEHPLLHMDNVICTPHLGYASQDQLRETFDLLIDQVVAFAEGKPIGVVNESVLARAAT